MKGTMLLDMNKIIMWRLTRDQTKYELAFQKLGANNGFDDKADDGRQAFWQKFLANRSLVASWCVGTQAGIPSDRKRDYFEGKTRAGFSRGFTFSFETFYLREVLISERLHSRVRFHSSDLQKITFRAN